MCVCIVACVVCVSACVCGVCVCVCVFAWVVSVFACVFACVCDGHFLRGSNVLKHLTVVCMF